MKTELFESLMRKQEHLHEITAQLETLQAFFQLIAQREREYFADLAPELLRDTPGAEAKAWTYRLELIATQLADAAEHLRGFNRFFDFQALQRQNLNVWQTTDARQGERRKS